MVLPSDDPRAGAARIAIRSGNLDGLRQVLSECPELATATIEFADGAARTLLHMATDWPGHFPNNVETVELLIAAGADVNARVRGPHTETPLHWAASSDDLDVLDALLDAGADIEADGAVIRGGTALADATAFAQWRCARRLIERGAASVLFESAVMGLLDRVASDLAADPPPSARDICGAFWGACHGGQRDVAEYLLERGAEINWVAPWNGETPLDAANRGEYSTLATWLIERGAQRTQT